MKCDDLPKKERADGTLVVEKRSGKDRRQTDVTGLGLVERRKRAEPRHPDVVELQLSDEEWAQHFGKPED